MSKLSELIAQQEALSKQIDELRKQERTEAIGKAMALISEYLLTQQDLFGGAAGTKKVKAVSKVAVKYRDDKSDKTWTGRGVTPKWISTSGKDKSAFLIA